MTRSVFRLMAAVCAIAWLGVAAPTYAARPAAQSGPSFTVVNHLPQPVRELYVTPAGLANWGRNRLDGKNGNPASLPSGASMMVRRDANCVFDMRVVFADGRAEERRGVNVCATEEVAIGAAAPGSAPVSAALDPATGKPGDDPSVRIFNRSAYPITEFYAGPSGGNAPGANRVTGNPVKPDATLAVSLPRDGNCFYDLRVVFADKRAMEKRHANLCRVAEIPVP
jgi:hypothetical protein